MIDSYVSQRLFADDEYDPVESTYREAFSDYGGNVGASPDTAASVGMYPEVLSDTAEAVLGTSESGGSGIGSRMKKGQSSNSVINIGNREGEGSKGDGITSVLISTSDFLVRKLGLSTSVSYFLISGGALVGLTVIPGTFGVLYQGLQRMQIDRGEMKLYGKLTDIDATAKKPDDDDDDDDAT